MQLGCGGCSVQQATQLAQMLMNPVTWLVVGTAVVSLWPKKKAGKK